MEMKDFTPVAKHVRINYIVEYCMANYDTELLERYMRDWNRLYRHYPALVCRLICDIYGVTMEQLHSKTRKREVVVARQVCAYYFVRVKKTPFQEVADYFNKDHASMHHACRVVKDLLSIKSKEVYPQFIEFQAKLLEYEDYL